MIRRRDLGFAAGDGIAELDGGGIEFRPFPGLKVFHFGEFTQPEPAGARDNVRPANVRDRAIRGELVAALLNRFDELTDDHVQDGGTGGVGAANVIQGPLLRRLDADVGCGYRAPRHIGHPPRATQ